MQDFALNLSAWRRQELVHVLFLSEMRSLYA